MAGLCGICSAEDSKFAAEAEDISITMKDSETSTGSRGLGGEPVTIAGCGPHSGRIWLVGPQLSGKSTLFRQLQYQFGAIDEAKMQKERVHVMDYIVQLMSCLAQYTLLLAEEGFLHTIIPVKMRPLIEEIATIQLKSSLRPDLSQRPDSYLIKFKKFQQSEVMKEVMSRHMHRYPIADSTQYWFENMHRFLCRTPLGIGKINHMVKSMDPRPSVVKKTHDAELSEHPLMVRMESFEREEMQGATTGALLEDDALSQIDESHSAVLPYGGYGTGRGPLDLIDRLSDEIITGVDHDTGQQYYTKRRRSISLSRSVIIEESKAEAKTEMALSQKIRSALAHGRSVGLVHLCDTLRLEKRTFGVNTLPIVGCSERDLTLCDTGGAPSEIRKWFKFLDERYSGNHGLVFVMNLSSFWRCLMPDGLVGYGEYMRFQKQMQKAAMAGTPEDDLFSFKRRLNGMTHTLQLFERILKDSCLPLSCPIFVWITGIDSFRERLALGREWLVKVVKKALPKFADLKEMKKFRADSKKYEEWYRRFQAAQSGEDWSVTILEEKELPTPRPEPAADGHSAIGSALDFDSADEFKLTLSCSSSARSYSRTHTTRTAVTRMPLHPDVDGRKLEKLILKRLMQELKNIRRGAGQSERPLFVSVTNATATKASGGFTNCGYTDGSKQTLGHTYFKRPDWSSQLEPYLEKFLWKYYGSATDEIPAKVKKTIEAYTVYQPIAECKRRSQTLPTAGALLQMATDVIDVFQRQRLFTKLDFKSPELNDLMSDRSFVNAVHIL